MLFNIFEHPATKELRAVKKGWNWYAFFFGRWWALFSGLWSVFFTFIIIDMVFGAFSFMLSHYVEHNGISQMGAFVLLLVFLIYTIGMFYIPAKNGNQWKERKLLKKGYIPRELIEASNEYGALAQYRATYTS